VAIDIFRVVEERANALPEQRIHFKTLMERAIASQEKGQSISLPEFQAFGWSKFDEFLDRFEESLNSPLLEKVRSILEAAGVILNPEMIARLKIGLVVRGEQLLEITSATTGELNKIGNAEIKEKARQGIVKHIEESKWDNLITGVSGWRELEKQLSDIIKGKSNKSHLYNVVFDLTLQEGPTSKLAQTLRSLEDTAFALGGKTLKQQIKFESSDNPANPLADIEAKLSRIAQGKEKARQILGEDILLDSVVKRGITLKGIIEALDKEYIRLSQLFDSERRRASELLIKHNNLATLLREPSRSLPSDLNIKKLRIFIGELGKSIDILSDQLEKSLSPDSRLFIENILEGRLPDLNEQRIFSVLQELLSKGFSFEVKLRG
jgi:hypothetical protein